MNPSERAVRPVSFGEAVRVWAKIGLLSFGGPAGQVALMHQELVERRKWIDEERFLHALSYCMLLPGPEAQQLAVYIGWLMHRTAGGLAAGLLFVLPGFLTILALSMLYAGFHELPAVAAVFFGLKSAVLAVVVEAVARIGKRALKTRWMVGVAGLAFVAIFLFKLPFPLIVLGAGLLGFATNRFLPAALPRPAPRAEHAVSEDTVIDVLATSGGLSHTDPSWRRALGVLALWGGLWILPVAALALTLGATSVYVKQAVFFSETAMVTFGGAYAVLAFIAQRAVENYGWLRPGEMLDGLGLAETTPGPLIMVVEFVGFLGAYRDPGALPPMLAGTAGAIVTVWVTFVPCFLWIFLGAPYIESLRGNRAIQAALSTITAAIVGVILNLSVWFGLHVCFRELSEQRLGPLSILLPDLATVDGAAVVLTLIALLAVFRFKVALPKVLAGNAVLGAAWSLMAR